MKPLPVIRIGAREIHENEPLTSGVSPPVQVSNVPTDPTSEQRMRIVEVSGTLDFWDHPQEDIYSPDDGQPL